MAHITFALPGDYRSGGVRVTVIMANQLLERGHQVRIACPKRLRTRRPGVRDIIAMFWKRSSKNDGWLHQFKGSIQKYDRLDDLEFAPGEVVIAVGTYMVADVRGMTKPVLKVRYNHGFPAKPDAAQEAAWHGRMPTITVSNTLVPRLQAQTENSVWGVVPNGINTREYHPEPGVVRDGIGAVYNPHANKAPEDLIAVLQMAHERWPHIPQYVFSAEPQPPGLEHTHYTQLPPVDQARRIYSQAKAWLLTSRTEGLPGVVLEAMACGCVVVSSDNDGSLEILRHEVNGLIAPRGDRPAYLEQLGRILTDEPLRERLANGSAATISEFTWDRAADRMEAFLRDVSKDGTAAT